MRRLLLLAALATVTVACADAPEPPATEIEARAVEFARLNAAVAEVAHAQAAADPLLANHLETLRRFDAIIEDLRDPEVIDAARERWQGVAAAFEELEVEGLRSAFRDVAFEVDEARISLSRASEQVADEWEQAYLRAQDEVLVAVREYAREADALAQVIGANQDVYARVAEETSEFVDRRWFYRSPEEAADAYEVEIGRLLPDLQDARQLLARYVGRRDEAGLAVNDATARAADIWASRPGDLTSASSAP